MKKGSIIARNYAKALFELAQNSNNIEKAVKDLEVFTENFTEEFALELRNPAISRKDSVKIIQEVCNKLDIKGLVLDFILTIAQNRRIGVLSEIKQEFISLVKKHNNILEVEVISAYELKDEQIKDLKDIILKKYQDKKIELTKTIKTNILGGVQIKIGSNLIDASLRNQLSELKKGLIDAI